MPKRPGASSARPSWRTRVATMASPGDRSSTDSRPRRTMFSMPSRSSWLEDCSGRGTAVCTRSNFLRLRPHVGPLMRLVLGRWTISCGLSRLCSQPTAYAPAVRGTRRPPRHGRAGGHERTSGRKRPQLGRSRGVAVGWQRRRADSWPVGRGRARLERRRWTVSWNQADAPRSSRTIDDATCPVGAGRCSR